MGIPLVRLGSIFAMMKFAYSCLWISPNPVKTFFPDSIRTSSLADARNIWFWKLIKHIISVLLLAPHLHGNLRVPRYFKPENPNFKPIHSFLFQGARWNPNLPCNDRFFGKTEHLWAARQPGLSAASMHHWVLMPLSIPKNTAALFENKAALGTVGHRRRRRRHRISPTL